MRITNLPTDLLRTFVTVVEVEGFTRAADILGRTQPAITLQVQRLERLVGHKLIVRVGKEVSLTEQGESLAVYARQILRLNDLAIAHFEPPTKGTLVRIGLPVDYAVDLLQSKLTKVIKDNPTLHIEIRCDLSKNLLELLHKNEIDIAVALFEGDDQQFLFQHWQEEPTWVGPAGFDLPKNTAIPLVVHPHGCVYRDRMTTALKLAGLQWRIAFSSPGIGALQKAINDGLGFSCLTEPTLKQGIRSLSAADGLPTLEPLHIGLFARQAQIGSAGYTIIDQIEQTFVKRSATPAK
ncbi:LysR substrate-binding domain-containing protein [Amylibacter sp. IMCC11727]|uniref:LysR substrate-binding domain-containing protein n=1 Tax=Amylibacter sp. IMCC11727 TaxID=3039851 RepID=UPI00244E0295|nr:LysR substrate-binding domain-containing protein [Amylibacter sp. IMCC11727]WGI23286.1 LysR family transcriptional regulator [Amylibacter sp. IMCC11727]